MYLCRYELNPGNFSPIVYVTTDGHVLGHFLPYKSYSYHMAMNKHLTKSVLRRLVTALYEKSTCQHAQWLLPAALLLWKLQAEFGKEQRKKRQETGRYTQSLKQWTPEPRQTQTLTLKQGLQPFCILLQARVPLHGYHRTSTGKAKKHCCLCWSLQGNTQTTTEDQNYDINKRQMCIIYKNTAKYTVLFNRRRKNVREHFLLCWASSAF